MTTHKVTLLPSGKVVEIEEGINLLKALRAQDIYIKSSCGGVANCSDCMIKIASGEENITPPPFEELALLGNVFHITKERLSCQTCVQGDVTIDITGHNKGEDEQRRQQKTNKLRKSKNVRVRKKGEVEEIKKQREQEQQENDEKRREESNEWHEHWKKEKDPTKPKKLGGNRRPKKKKD